MLQSAEPTIPLLGRQLQSASPAPQPAGRTVALIPAYNEERFIGSLVLATQSFVDQVVVIDDGSRDRTAEIARMAGATVVQHQANQGKAAAVTTGFAYARQLSPAAVVMLDGDGQHRSAEIPVVLAPVLSGEADLVVGSRFLEVRSDIPAYRQIGQHALTVATNVASGVRVSDSQSGYRAFSARALETLTFGQSGFTVESEMQFQAREHQLRVIEVPISVVYAEPAKRNPFAHGVQVLDGILQLVGQMRPLFYFGVPGMLCVTMGLLLGVYIVDIFTRTSQLAVGYGLVTVILCVVGITLFFAGVILHSTRGMITELRRTLLDRIAHPEQR